MARRMMSRLKLILIILFLGWLAYFSYFRFFMSWGGFGDMGAMPVGVAEVIEREVRGVSEFSGKLVAVEKAEIRPRITGVIESVNFSDGQMVKKGDLLFVIDPRPYQAAFEAAYTTLSVAESDLKRASALLASKSIPQREYDQRRNAADSARAAYTKAKIDLDYTHIKSPIAGRASRAEITVGNLVESGMGMTPLLTTIIDSDPIYADFEIDEATFLKYASAGVTGSTLAKTIPVTLSLDGVEKQGRVESFDNKVDNVSGTVRVRAIFDNADGALVHGLFARVKIASAVSAKSLLITDKAIGTDQNKKFVLVVGTDNKVEHRDIKLGGMVDGLRIVESGLKAGEKIIVSGTQRVMMPSQEVKPEIVGMDGAGAQPTNAEPQQPTPAKE